MKTKRKFSLFFIILIITFFPIITTKGEQLPKENNIFAPSEAPMFDAGIEYSSQGFIVRGTFTESLSDINLVQPLYSLDGENYQVCSINWDLNWLDDDENTLAKSHHQFRLYSNQEPLKSYLEEKIDRFYLKLCLTRENGTTYETQVALIDRGSPQPVPKGVTPAAKFDSSMFVRDSRPFCGYGKYQLTISENATPEDISAFLPDTLPIEIQLQNEKGIQYFTKGVVECPVTWKPLSLPELTAGEHITLTDAAEEIVIPEGTLLTTPTGIFRLNEPLKLDMNMDEVRLVLNVIAENENPTGVLSAENNRLEMAFHLKPTGATAIRAYTFSKGGTEWIEIPNLSLLNAINAQPSTANSGYTLVLDNTCEPYQSYLAAANAGETPEPFFVGLKIEGGTYDGQQLVLAWPDTYELPMNLPEIGGSGGNEVNAGADNTDDSTEEGQRPNLPQNTNTQTTQSPDTQHTTPQNSNTQFTAPHNSDTQFTTPHNSDTQFTTPSENHFNSENQKNQEKQHIPDQLHSSAPPIPMVQTKTGTDAVEEMHSATVLADAATKPAKNDTPISPISAAVASVDSEQTDPLESKLLELSELPERSIKKDRYSLSLLVIVFIIVLVIMLVAAGICIPVSPSRLTSNTSSFHMRKRNTKHRNT